jgi:RNA polymerase sigma factor (sigma-70 family)
MNLQKTETAHFLKQWNEGDPDGLDALLDRHLPWIREHVHHRIGPLLRKMGDTCDYVQDAMVQFLQYGPRFTVKSDDQFRALLRRIVENSLRNQHDRFVARRREIALERPIPSDTVISLEYPRASKRTPSMSAERHEREAWIRLGMEFLDAEDRHIILLRKWDGLSFPEIGKRLDITKDAARMKHNRAVLRLAKMVGVLRKGKLPLPEEKESEEHDE